MGWIEKGIEEIRKTTLMILRGKLLLAIELNGIDSAKMAESFCLMGSQSLRNKGFL